MNNTTIKIRQKLFMYYDKVYSNQVHQLRYTALI